MYLFPGQSVLLHEHAYIFQMLDVLQGISLQCHHVGILATSKAPASFRIPQQSAPLRVQACRACMGVVPIFCMKYLTSSQRPPWFRSVVRASLTPSYRGLSHDPAGILLGLPNLLMPPIRQIVPHPGFVVGVLEALDRVKEQMQAGVADVAAILKEVRDVGLFHQIHMFLRIDPGLQASADSGTTNVVGDHLFPAAVSPLHCHGHLFFRIGDRPGEVVLEVRIEIYLVKKQN